MSSPSNQTQPVVQTILESFTRCFNPLDPCTKVVCSSKNDCTNGAPRKMSSSPSQLFGYNISGSISDARAVSRSSSSSDSQQRKKLSLDVSYDADGVAKAKKTHHRMSAKALEERSMKRKLQIFRGTGQEVMRPPPKLAPRTQAQRQSPPPPSSRQSSPHGDLTLSDDEEELIRLTQSRKRFACGMNMDRIQNNSPISRVARLFNVGISEAQKPFGLCFATPVRTPYQENVANLSDDKLTDDEFLRRHGGDASQITPDLDQSSYCEEETISSTLYFDQKYSHMIETRPPMPLFQEHMLSCTESDHDELSKMINRRSSNKGSQNPPMTELVTSKQQRKKGSSRGGGGSARKSSREPPSPLRIRDESLSMESDVQKLLEPDVVRATIAEI